MFNSSGGELPEFVDQRVGYVFTYVQMCANQAIRLTELEGRSVPAAPISRAKWVMAGKEAERLEIYLTGILSAALFFEAYSFDYAARKNSLARFRKPLEKLDPPARWAIATSLVAPPGLDQGHHAVGQMIAICRKRNELVHNKSRAAESFHPPPPVSDEFNPLAFLKAVVEFCDLLYCLDSSESFAKYVSRHVRIWANDAMQGILDYPVLANVDP
jgi:hypothetical protein